MNVIIVTVLFCVVGRASGFAQKCCIEAEAAKILAEAFHRFAYEKNFVSDACGTTIQQIENMISSKNFSAICKSRAICNTRYSNECEDVCNSVYKDALQTMDTIEKKFENGEYKAVDVMKNVCKNDSQACEDLIVLPILEDVAPNYREIIKVVRGTASHRAMPESKALNQGVKLLFGDGLFGIKVSKCVNEVVKNLTKFAKNFKFNLSI